MGKIIKKGTRGQAANYISRTRAIRKLQISLAQFRRLCILKGIYPRAPSSRKKASKNGNTNTTFYFTKDIKFMMHDPLIQKFREHKIFLRKLKKAVSKQDLHGARLLEDNEPLFNLDHLVKERYPSFVDALKDLDDCLCHVFLFATLPISKNLPAEIIERSQRLACEFQNYITHTHALQKSFVSIKGIYYQASIRSIPVTWIVPHQFSVPIPDNVDLRVMKTFLEFYSTLLAFVNFKLYTEAGLKYPPQIDVDLEEGGAWLSSYLITDKDSAAVPPPRPLKDSTNVSQEQLKSLQGKLADIASHQVDEQADNDATEAMEEEDEFEKQPMSGMIVFLGREVPRYSLEFVLRSLGAVVCYPETSGRGSPYPESSPKITHQISDRPLETMSLRHDRIYVQPQWAFDCLNAGQVLDCNLYSLGKPLPPHLSPFAEYHDDEEEHEDVVEAEAVEPVKTKVSQEEQRKSEVERAKQVMSNKKRKLYESIQKKEKQKTDKQNLLAEKRRSLRSNKK